MNLDKENKHQPNKGCAFLTPKPDGKGYICAALSELMCATRGKCKFVKPREGKHAE